MFVCWLFHAAMSRSLPASSEEMTLDFFRLSSFSRSRWFLISSHHSTRLRADGTDATESMPIARSASFTSFFHSASSTSCCLHNWIGTKSFFSSIGYVPLTLFALWSYLSVGSLIVFLPIGIFQQEVAAAFRTKTLTTQAHAELRFCVTCVTTERALDVHGFSLPSSAAFRISSAHSDPSASTAAY